MSEKIINSDKILTLAVKLENLLMSAKFMDDKKMLPSFHKLVLNHYIFISCSRSSMTFAVIYQSINNSSIIVPFNITGKINLMLMELQYQLIVMEVCQLRNGSQNLPSALRLEQTSSDNVIVYPPLSAAGSV